MKRDVVYATAALATVPAMFLAGVALVVAPHQAEATSAIASKTGRSCASCHVNPSGGGGLTAAGKAYQSKGSGGGAAAKAAPASKSGGDQKKDAKPAAAAAAPAEPAAPASTAVNRPQDCSAFYDDYRRRGFGWGSGPGTSLGFGTFEGATPRYPTNAFPNWYGECLNWGYYNAEPLGKPAASPEAAPDQGPRIAFLVSPANIPVGQAAQSSIPLGLGLWKQEGLNVKVVGVADAAEAIAQVANRQADFASVDPQSLLAARAKGMKVKAIFAHTQRPIYQVVVLAGSSIAKPGDLKDKTIGVPDMNGSAVPFARAVLKASNIDPERDVRWAAAGASERAANALRQQTVDAWVSSDVEVAALENDGLELRQISPDLAREVPGQVVIAREDTISKHGDRVIKVARALAKATVLGLANPESAVRKHWAMYPKTNPQTKDSDKALKDALHALDARLELARIDEGAKWGHSDEAKWNRMAEIAKAEGTIPADFDVASAYTNAFIDEINKFDSVKLSELAKRPRW